jgi:hypothetical protein
MVNKNAHGVRGMQQHQITVFRRGITHDDETNDNVPSFPHLHSCSNIKYQGGICM